MIPQLRERLADWMRDDAFSAGLLVTRYVSEPLAQRLRDAGVCFADSVGNAYLEIPGTILVSSVGHSPPPEEPSHANWLTVQGAKVLFHLLSRGPQVRSTYREMNRRLGVSLGMTSKVIVELLANGILERQGRGAYDIVQPGRLLEMWADAYASRLRQRTLVARFSAPFGRDYAQIFRRSSLLNPLSGATIGGEYGAVLMMDPADAAQVSLYVPASQTVAVRRLLGLIPTDEGDLELHEAFADPLGRTRIKGEPPRRRSGPRLRRVDGKKRSTMRRTGGPPASSASRLDHVAAEMGAVTPRKPSHQVRRSAQSSARSTIDRTKSALAAT